jgi:uncharacterized protein YyaL (SSP411 family)
MTSAPPPENRLGRETSPYLLQHKDNPVHWWAWGPEALAEAKRIGKPILLSVGYAACHWCHVMAHESFEDVATAAVMNDLFVNIKVDREERPDIDAIYMRALHNLGEQGGWPLTMFLDSEARPFWGGTYFPPTPRYGRPGFADLLAGVAKVFHDEPDRIKHNVEALREGLQKLSQPRAGAGIPIALLDQITEHLVQQIDQFRGGIGRAPKFPQCGIMEQLWRAWRRSGKEPFRKAVQVTLDNMCQGGIYDHLGGGFARYSVDERWLVPHFEKMLYDNAELVDLLTLVWQDRRSPLYAQRVEETVGWVLREMRNDQGAFASSLDADSEGVEGKFYVWSEAEIDGLLGPRSAPFKAIYDVTRHGNWEESNILNRLSRIELLDPASEAPLAADRAVLLDARAKRIPPGLDDKVLADWNGLMIAALAFAGDAFARPEWIAAAQSAFRFVQSEMMVDGRLRHSWRDGRARHPATLDDYAALCRAALALYEATGDAAYITQAEAWLAIVEAQYADPAGPGYFFTAADTPTLITRRKDANDHATPAGNGVLVSVFARLFYVTGKDDYRVRADRLIGAFSGEIQTNFFPLSSLLNGAELLQSAVQIVLLGEPADAATDALADALRHVSLPNRIVIRLRPGQALPPDHPAAGKTLVGGAPTAYVCHGMTCSPPMTDAAALRAELEAS